MGALVGLEDYTTNRKREHELLLIAAAYHTAAHRKYGGQPQPSRRSEGRSISPIFADARRCFPSRLLINA
jgi:hypothetical protein